MSELKKDMNYSAKEPEQYEYVIATSSSVSNGMEYNPLFARKQQAPVCYVDNEVEDWMTISHEYWDHEDEVWVIDNDLDTAFDKGETDIEMPKKDDFFKRLGIAQSEYDKTRPPVTVPPSPED